MDSTRKQQLKALIRSRFEDNQQKFADCVSLSKGRISQLLDDGEPFGERAAKNLLDKLADAGVHLPNGYFEASPITDVVAQHQAKPRIDIEDAIAAIRAEIEQAKSAGSIHHIEHAWPFKGIKRDQWENLTPEQKAIVESVASGFLIQHAAGASASHTEKRQATG